MTPEEKPGNHGQHEQRQGKATPTGKGKAAPAAREAPLEPGLRVRVHRNLHRGDWSVTDPRIGRVIAHVSDITLTGARFRVQPAGVEAIRATGRRLVCAYAVGTLAAACSAPDVADWQRVSFNPWRATTFTTAAGRPITDAPLVVFTGDAGWVQPSLPTESAAVQAPAPGASRARRLRAARTMSAPAPQEQRAGPRP